jgi:NTE family protein
MPTREVVLALGGGAARAASHAGVLQVLEAAGVRPLAVSGFSAGGLVAAMIALGMPSERIIARFAEFAKTSVYQEMRRAFGAYLRETRNTQTRTRPRYFGMSSLAFFSDSQLSALSSDHLFSFVEHFVGRDSDISALQLPCSVVATDLVEGIPVKLSHGSLHAVLAASCAVPGLFPPQRLEERLFVDGSSITEVPIWAAHLLGSSALVLAVYLGRPSHRISDYQTSTEVSTRANALIHAELVREQLRRADLLLTVPMDTVGWLDFRHADRIVAIGRHAAEAALPRLLERLDRSSSGAALADRA